MKPKTRRRPASGTGKVPFSYGKLFWSTFIISAFTVGGGFVIIPLLKAKYVDEYGWIDDTAAPGVVAANAAVILGYRMGGFLGTAVALLATVLPPLITLTLVSYFYEAFKANPYARMILKGMQCGVSAVLIDVLFGLVQKQVRKKLALPLLIMAGSFVASVFFHVPIMEIIFIDAVLGLLLMRDPIYN